VFDDGVITLGHGFISVDGEMVSGSRQYVRDPRLHHPTDRMIEAAFRRSLTEVQYKPLPSGTKWCCAAHHLQAVIDAHHAGTLDKTLDYEQATRGFMPVDYFGIDRRSFDKRRSWCRLCDAAKHRIAYAAKVDHPVRSYRRRG